MSKQTRSTGNANGYEMASIFNTPVVEPTPEAKHAAAVRVLVDAKTGNWPVEETVQVLRQLGLDEVPVVAEAFARHGIEPLPVAKSA